MFKKSIRYKIILPTIAVLVALVCALSFKTSSQVKRYIDNVLDDNLQKTAINLKILLSSMKNETKAAAMAESVHRNVVEAVRNRDTNEIIRLISRAVDMMKVDYFTVSDDKGIVLARVHDPSSFGDSVLNQQNVQEALKGNVATYYETGTTIKAAIRTGAPVFDVDGTIIGVISAGIRMDTDKFVDKFKEDYGLEFTVFQGDTRISTSIIENGQRIIGTKLNPDIADIVLNNRQEYFGMADILGVPYKTYYMPLINNDNSVFGILFLGSSEADMLAQTSAFIRDMIIISLIGLVAAIVIMLFVIRSITNPISKLNTAVWEITKGNLSYPIRNNRNDEFGSLANCIGDMVDELVKHSEMTAIMDNLDSMICVSDLDYNLLFINKQLADTFGVDRESCIGQKCFKAIRKKDTPCSICQKSELLSREESFSSKRYEHVWDDDLSKWISGTNSIIHWVDGSMVLFQSMRDSSKQKQQEELLHETLKETKNASAAKSSFLANMSHEIRTPMNAILGIAEIQLHNDTLDPDMREAFTRIHNAGDLLLSIINDILDLSKIEAGRMELSLHKYEVASMINDTVTLNLIRKGNKPIEFVLSVAENTPSTLIGDDLRIKQILNNLLSNAFKYTVKGVVKLSISAETEKNDNSDIALVFVVSDTGQGMTGEQIENLFDEYARFNSEANRTTEGTGLGMSIAQQLISMMNGTISVKSEVDRGSVFTVCLPQEISDSNVLGKEVAQNLESFKLNEAKQIRKTQIVYEPMPYGSVLVVDDMESNLYVTNGLLKPYGLSVDTATSGFEAIAKVEDGIVYDIIFMDHMMPKMDGIEATGKIRALGYTHPIIALTANAVAGQADVFLKSGFDGFISKPIDLRQLSTAIKKFVRDKQGPEVIEAVRKQASEQKKHKANALVLPQIDQQLAEFFVHDASMSVAVLEEVYEKNGVYEDEDVRMFTTTVHAMKSALANIGESELSSHAAKLEQAGRDKDVVVISSETPVFLGELRAIIEKLIPLGQTGGSDEPLNEDYTYLQEKLFAIKEACEIYDKKTIKAKISELRQKTWPHPIKELLSTMAEQLLGGDFEKVSDITGKIIKIISTTMK